MREACGVLLTVITRIASLSARPDDSDDERLRKGTLVVASGLLIVAGLVWAATYAALGLWRAAGAPLLYAATSAVTFGHFALTRRYELFRFWQLLLILVLPYLTQWALGGFAASGAVMVWAFMAPIGALLFHGVRHAVGWLAAFLLLAVGSGLLDGRMAAAGPPVSPGLSQAFFVMNIAGLTTAMYLIMRYFVREKEQAQERSERLLLNVLPKPIADRLKREPRTIADGYADVTVLFADIADFTQYAAGIGPQQVVAVLDDVFSEFDRLAERYGVEKIKTIGDAYMVVGGLPTPRPDHAEAVAEMALSMQAALDGCRERTGAALQVRIGMHSGPVIAGVIGRKKFIYDLWGDTVNTASRMESYGLPGRIHVSDVTRARLADRYAFEPRPPIEVKGKGLMATFFLVGRLPRPAPVEATAGS